MKNFAQALAKLRRESGFSTPYAFYHKNGGKHAFPFTFAYYLKIERGESLPRPQWLPALLSLLRIPPTEALYRKFVTDYFKDVCGDEDTYQALISPLLCHHIKEKPEKQAAKRLMTEKAYHISPAQFKAILTSHATCWSFECLVNDIGSFTAEELAETTELPLKEIKAGLKKLLSHKLIKKSKSGRYSSPLATKFYIYPRTYKDFEKDRARLWLLEDQMSKKLGAELFNGGILMRAEEGAVRKAMRGLSDSIEAAGAYSVDEKGEGTGLFLLQARVRKILNF
jgi:hypothetical protein